MEMSSTLAMLIAAAALGLNLVLALKSGAWGMADRMKSMEDRIMQAVNAHKSDIDVNVETARDELRAAIETSERRYGDTIAAIRQKIHEVEMYMRDTYMRRDSFVTSIQETREFIRDSTGRLEIRLDRMEKKMDSANGRHTSEDPR